MKILVLNGSPQGKRANGVVLLKKHWPKEIPYQCVHLADAKIDAVLFKKILEAPAIVFMTGTYWDSWGSPLQKFLEQFTAYEGHKKLMGKPAACVVLMHSVGGKSILSRLQGVLNTFGFLLPPMSGMVYSLVTQESIKAKSSHADDFWQAEDLEVLVHNLVKAQSLKIDWTTWPVDRQNPKRIWFKK